MASTDLLQTFLQLHLATDATAVTNLSSVLSALSSDNLESSSHLAKWTNRVNALIHSRDSGARWAGITLALHTSKLSRNILISSAQSWVSTVLPMLSKNESSAVWKASIRLLAAIFTWTTNLAEFQRHVVTPNVTKFSSALISLAEKQPDEELKVLCLDVLSTIVPLYPTLHRQLASTLSAVSLSFLNGSPTSTHAAIVSSASRLYACLHIIGGKVGGATLWRKNVDETISFCCAAVAALRTTYADGDRFAPPQFDPLVFIPLNLDRLYCEVELLCHLLRAKVGRPVSVPVQSLVNLCVEMLRVTKKGELPNGVDPSIRGMEAAVVPSILDLGCTLTGCLSRCIQNKFAPHLSRVLDIVAYHLEQPVSVNERLPLIRLLPSLLGSCLPPTEPLTTGRVIKTILPPIANLLSQKTADASAMPMDVGSRKGKKRARDYEGDEVFKMGRDALCENTEAEELVVLSLDALQFLLRVPNIPSYLQSLSSRLLLSLLLALPKLSASSVAHNPNVKDEILRRVKSACIELASGSSVVLCKSLPLVVEAVTDNKVTRENALPRLSDQTTLLLDLMLHPRLPPLLRPIPPLDTIALSQSEESKDEGKTRESLDLHSIINDTGPDEEAGKLNCLTSTHEMQQTTAADSGPAPMCPSAGPSVQPVIPDVPVQLAAPFVVQPTRVAATVPPQGSMLDAESNAPRVQETPRKIDELQPPPSSDLKEGQTQPARPAELHNDRTQAYRLSEPTRMIVDNEDDDEDIEMPVINLESDTDSEAE